VSYFFSNYKFHILIFFFSSLILTRFNIDPDLGWHLAIGDRFLETGQIIRGDEFSWTMPGFIFGNYFFAYQILVAFILNNFGHLFLSLLFGILASLAVLILLPKKIDFWQTVVSSIGIVLAVFALGVRPSTISFLMFSVQLYLLNKNFFKRTVHILFWVLFFSIWANFHQGFIYGLFVFALWIGADWISKAPKDKKVLFGLGCLLSAFIGTFLTPFHSYVYRSIFMDLTGSKTWSSIAEWGPGAISFPFNLLYALSGLVVIYMFFKSFKVLDPKLFSVAVVVFSMPFLAINTIVFWAAFFIFVTSRYLEFKIKGEENFWVKLPTIYSLISVFIVFFLSFILSVLESVDLQSRLIKDDYPVEAVEYMKANGLEEGIFNEYAWGGYLDWQFVQAKVFIDGRMTGWRSNDVYILNDYLKISRGECDPLKKFDVKVALVRKENKSNCFNNWNEIYKDEVAKVLIE